MAPSLMELFYEGTSPATKESIYRQASFNVKQPVKSYVLPELSPFSSDNESNSSGSTVDTDEKNFYEFQTGATTPDLQPPHKSKSTRASSERLWHDLQTTAKWGQIEGTTGMTRLALSDEDKLCRDWFVAETKAMGCDVRVDGMGNVFSVYPGENNNLAPIGMGSHMDTQPLGGMYDGILGCLAGVEVLRTIHESGIKPYCPIAAIIWTNEEGVSYNPGCSGSAVWAGKKTVAAGHGQINAFNGITLLDDLKRIGYHGSYYPDYRLNPLSAHFELHIEQGSKLERANKKIGVVTGVQGIRWYKARVTGTRAHAGSTPMPIRADALVATARIITLLQEQALKWAGVATVGNLHLEDPTSNTIPGSTEFSIDIRHPTEEGLNAIESAVKKEMSIMTLENPKLNFSIDQTWESPAAKFDATALDCIRKSADEEVGQDLIMEMYSLAGHDSALVAKKIPTAMIFVPSRNGLSHSPEEFTSEEDCGYGCQVLLDSVLKYDAALRKHSVVNDTRVELNRLRIR